MIPYGRQLIDDDDIKAVTEVLRSDFLTQGSRVPEFEQALCQYTGASYGVVANSATSCLHIACLALDLGPEDTLWCPPITFVATANCALYCGAKIDFVDIDPLTANIDVASLTNKLARAEQSATLPKILIVVHMAGASCEMREISALAKKYHIKLIEDASHAVGGRYLDQPVGNCAWSDITVFSFHPVKIITTAEGGAAMTNDQQLASRMQLFRSHGVTRDPALMQTQGGGQWRYEQICLGLNYRMTELQAVLGLSQMNKLDQFVETRNAMAQVYDDAFESVALTPIKPIANCLSAYHLYMVLLDPAMAGGGRERVFDRMREQGVGVNVHYIPVHTQPYYQNLGFNTGDFPRAEDYYSRVISIPLFPGLAVDDQQYVIETLTGAIEKS